MGEQERDEQGRFSGSGGSGSGGAASKDEARQASGRADAKSKAAFRGANIREKHNDAANAHREAAERHTEVAAQEHDTGDHVAGNRHENIAGQHRSMQDKHEKAAKSTVGYRTWATKKAGGGFPDLNRAMREGAKAAASERRTDKASSIRGSYGVRYAKPKGE